MSRVAVSEEMAAYIAARIAAFPLEADEKIRWQTRYVAEFGALPLYLGMAETHGIRPGGEIVSWSTEGDYIGVRSVDDRIWVLSALIDGAVRYPEIRRLLPECPAGAVDCPRCKHPLHMSGEVVCGTCGGVGWLPAQG